MSPISVDSSYHSSSSSSSSLSSLHRGQTLERSHHPAVIECETSDRHRHRSGRHSLSSSPIVPATELQIQQARDGLLHALAISGGATDSDAFRNALLVLQEHYTTDHNHMRATAQNMLRTSASQQAEGLWLTLTKPSFFDCLGDNDQGDPMYTLARMSFNMFCPANLICSLQGNFNSVERVHDRDPAMAVPASLREAVLGHDDPTALRTYKLVVFVSVFCLWLRAYCVCVVGWFQKH